MTTREIITLQFGNYANFVGAHYWNIQELSFDYTGTVKTEVNHDVLYREGQDRTGQSTYTPRLLIADLKGSTKTLPVSGGLYSPALGEPEPSWPIVEKIEEPKPKKNKYLEELDTEAQSSSKYEEYDFENNVETWSDFLYPRFHERTINIVKQYQYGDESQSFDTYSAGIDVWESQDFGEIFCDNIRKYVEECDSMQGFQISFDAVDGFSGIALGCIEHLVDEYSKTIFATPLIPSFFKDNKPQSEEEREKSTVKDSVRLINIMLTVQGLSEHAHFFVPLCTSEKGWRKPGISRKFDQLIYNPELSYHSSSIIATGLDTLSMKYRDKNNQYSLSDLSSDMTGYGRKMAAASLGLPFTMVESDYLIDHLNSVKKPLFTAITPSCKLGTDKLIQIFTVRGIIEARLKLAKEEANEQRNLAAYSCNSIQEMMQLYFQSTNYLSPTSVTTYKKPFEVKTPFPKIFSKDLSRFGFLKATERAEEIESVPVIAGFHNGTFMADHLEKLHRETKRIKISKMHMFSAAGFEAAEFSECLDKLEEFKDVYDDDYEL